MALSPLPSAGHNSGPESFIVVVAPLLSPPLPSTGPPAYPASPTPAPAAAVPNRPAPSSSSSSSSCSSSTSSSSTTALRPHFLTAKTSMGGPVEVFRSAVTPVGG
eukprot:7480990-Pyramimonas_sp.AAC.1